MQHTSTSKIQFYNILLDDINTEETIARCHEYYATPGNDIIFFLNAHCFNIAQKNEVYRDALNQVSILLNDGIGIKLGAKMAGQKIRENMNGTDFIPSLLENARDLNKNIYLLGGTEGTANFAKNRLMNKFPGISIVGTRNGYFDFDNDEDIIQDIINKKTDLLVIGMGVPRQELWLTKNKEKLQGVKISIAGGAILDFIAGNVMRAPEWMRKSGTEWIFRIYQEPRRLFNRYFIGIPVFFMNILKLKNS